MRFSFLILCILVFAGYQSFAQKPSEKETIAIINKMLGAQCSLEVAHGKVTASYSDQNHRLVREDKFAMGDLVITKAGFEPKENVYFIPCIGKDAGCVYRKMFLTGNFRYYDRVSFVIDGKEETVTRLTEAFKHLEKILDNPKYKGVVNLD